jgi:hypothetical protein
MSALSLLSGVKRKSGLRAVRSAAETDLEAEAKPLLARLPGSYFNHSLRGTACRPGQSIVPV